MIYKIKDLNTNKNEVDIVCKVEKVEVRTASNGSDYLILSLYDTSAKIEARLWNCSINEKERIQIGKFYEVKGKSNVFKNSIQFKISSINEISEDMLAKYSLNANDFYIKAKINVENEYKFINKTIKKFNNQIYSKITKAILKKYKEEFLMFPAAVSIHHNVVSGLLWHSVSLLKAAMGLKDVYSYCDIDWELVYAGVILHDIGKIIEMNSIQATEYTLAGKLLGHISIGNTFVKSYADKLKLTYNDDGTMNENVIKLQHAILASHGKNEFGSPVEPQLIESIIISSLDDLDARLYKVNDELSKIELNGYTQKIFSENNRSYLKHYKKIKKS